MIDRAAIYLESGIRDPFDAADNGEHVAETRDMAHVAARGIMSCVRHRLAFQSRCAGLIHDDRVKLIEEVADIVRRYHFLLAERTTTLMGNATTAMSGPEQTQQRQFGELRQLLDTDANKRAFGKIAAAHLKPDRLIRLLLSAASRNPKIMQCTPQSILQFCMKCAETGLEPIGAGGCWPIPRSNKQTKCMELTFLPDYRGLLNAARRAGCIRDGYAEAVYAGDAFNVELGLEQKITHKPARNGRGELEAAYVVLVMPDGSKRAVVMYREEIESIRNQSSEAWRSDGNTPWKTYPAEMWKKTVVRRAMKPFAGMSAIVETLLHASEEPGEDATANMIAAPEQAEQKPVKPITKGQTKAINDLVQKLQLPDDEIAKVIGGDVAALTEEQADVVRNKLIALDAGQSKE